MTEIEILKEELVAKQKIILRLEDQIDRTIALLKQAIRDMEIEK